ncbi:MAG TPA: DNA repair protein RecN [Gammaproteobacteria bacterium]|nr:DNA repair protein RecN [Gammaproteobacteria bacterium]
MLTQINISNLVTIEKASLDLSTGVTVITGETGAGKSILIEAIELALGGRASSQLIRANQEKLEISICVDLSKMPALPAILIENDLVDESGEYIIRRVISRDGKSKAFLNDTPVTLPMLRELSESLIDLHGQHEHQTLLKPEKHREILDNFGGHIELTRHVKQIADQYRTVSQQIQDHQTNIQQRAEKKEFLRFQLNELESLQLQQNEWQQLEAEHKELANADSLQQNLSAIVSHFSNEDANLLSQLHRSIKTLESLQHVHPRIAQWLSAVNTATIQLDDVANEIQQYLDNMDNNPERLYEIEQRMQSIHDMSRKYKVAPTDLLEWINKLNAEFALLNADESSLAELELKQQELLQSYKRLAQELSEKRTKAAKKLNKEITAIIQTLSLPHAEFQVELQAEPENSVWPSGLEKINFLVKTNKGTAFHPLIKIASGGELSRISLAIHLATAGQHTVPTMIFDEVDVGIGGSTAELVGQLLRRLGKTHQLLCITHLPQVAAYGNHHIIVQKLNNKEQTYTQIKVLSINDKVKEIARMLGGINITDTTLKHAQEMLEGVKY